MTQNNLKKNHWLKYQNPSALSNCHHFFPSAKFKASLCLKQKKSTYYRMIWRCSKGALKALREKLCGTIMVWWNFCCFLVHSSYCINWGRKELGRHQAIQAQFIEFGFSQKIARSNDEDQKEFWRWSIVSSPLSMQRLCTTGEWYQGTPTKWDIWSTSTLIPSSGECRLESSDNSEFRGNFWGRVPSFGKTEPSS